MKYYCKTCGAIFYDEQANKRFVHTDIECIRCSSIMKHYPDYETPEQYKKRTGKSYPDKGLVWSFNAEDKWECFDYWQYKQLMKDLDRLDKDFGIDDPNNTWTVVIADPPVPPPDDWRPE